MYIGWCTSECNGVYIGWCISGCSLFYSLFTVGLVLCSLLYLRFTVGLVLGSLPTRFTVGLVLRFLRLYFPFHCWLLIPAPSCTTVLSVAGFSFFLLPFPVSLLASSGLPDSYSRFTVGQVFMLRPLPGSWPMVRHKVDYSRFLAPTNVDRLILSEM